MADNDVLEPGTDEEQEQGPGETLAQRMARIAKERNIQQPQESLADRMARVAKQRGLTIAPKPESGIDLREPAPTTPKPPVAPIAIRDLPATATPLNLNVAPGGPLPKPDIGAPGPFAAENYKLFQPFKAEEPPVQPTRQVAPVPPLSMGETEKGVELARQAVVQSATAPIRAIKVLAQASSEGNQRAALAEAGQDPEQVPLTQKPKDVAIAAGQVAALGAGGFGAAAVEKMLLARGLSPTAARTLAGAVVGAPTGAIYNPQNPGVGAAVGSIFGGATGQNAAEPAPTTGPKVLWSEIEKVISDLKKAEAKKAEATPETPPQGGAPAAPAAPSTLTPDEVNAIIAESTKTGAPKVKSAAPEEAGSGTPTKIAAPQQPTTAGGQATAGPGGGPPTITKELEPPVPKNKPTLLEQAVTETEIRARAKFFGHDPDEAVQLYKDEVNGVTPKPEAPPPPESLQQKIDRVMNEAQVRELVPEGQHATEGEMVVRNIANGLTTGHPDAIANAAPEMATRVPPGAVLVPLPGENGDTSANTKLAQAIAGIVKGATVHEGEEPPGPAERRRIVAIDAVDSGQSAPPNAKLVTYAKAPPSQVTSTPSEVEKTEEQEAAEKSAAAIADYNHATRMGGQGSVRIPRELIKTPDDALQSSLFSVTGAEKRWKELREKGADDETLKKAIADEFGIQGGETTPIGFSDYKGGEQPQFKLSPSDDSKPVILKGKELLKKARAVLDIPYPGEAAETATKPVQKEEPAPKEKKPATPQVPNEPGTKYVLPSFITRPHAKKEETPDEKLADLKGRMAERERVAKLPTAERDKVLAPWFDALPRSEQIAIFGGGEAAPKKYEALNPTGKAKVLDKYTGLTPKQELAKEEPDEIERDIDLERRAQQLVEDLKGEKKRLDKPLDRILSPSDKSSRRTVPTVDAAKAWLSGDPAKVADHYLDAAKTPEQAAGALKKQFDEGMNLHLNFEIGVQEAHDLMNEARGRIAAVAGAETPNVADEGRAFVKGYRDVNREMEPEKVAPKPEATQTSKEEGAPHEPGQVRPPVSGQPEKEQAGGVSRPGRIGPIGGPPAGSERPSGEPVSRPARPAPEEGAAPEKLRGPGSAHAGTGGASEGAGAERSPGAESGRRGEPERSVHHEQPAATERVAPQKLKKVGLKRIEPETQNEISMASSSREVAERELQRHEDMLDMGLSTEEETRQAKRIVAILKQRLADLDAKPKAEPAAPAKEESETSPKLSSSAKRPSNDISSSEIPATENFVIPSEGLNLERGAVARAKDNVAAIKLLKLIESEQRTPTKEEQQILAKYVGWGGIAGYLDKGHKLYDSPLGKEIRDVLTPEEFRAAAASTPNAHYTSVDVARAIHEALAHLGFDGGRILEPSMGSGVFLGTTPPEKKYQWTGVELDSITGRIATLLYPKADVRVQGFQKTKAADGYFDVAAGNVPFGDYQVADPRYDKLKLPIHDYFFAKSLDLVRPGGVVAYITSRYTLDKRERSFRKYIAERADFLGAIRLPNTAFKGNAGTDVTTDIILLKVRAPGEAKGGEEFEQLAGVETPEGLVQINGYFARHPEMMLGTPSLAGTMYAGNEFTLQPHKGVDLNDALQRAIARLPKGIYTEREMMSPASRSHGDVPGAELPRAPDDMQDGTFVIRDGKLKQNNGGYISDPKVPSTRLESVRALTEIKDAAKELLNAEVANEPDAVIETKRKTLNKLYDSFVKARGPINTEQRVETSRKDKEGNPIVQYKYPNLVSFTDDPEYHWVSMLEDYDPESGTAKKADILERRVMYERKPPEHVDTPSLAIPVVLAEEGHVNLDRVAELSGSTTDKVIEALNGSVIFQDPTTQRWEVADQYLSGDVKTKLAEAQAAAKKDPRFKSNVEALEKAIPEDIPPSQIGAGLGSPWIPKSDVEDFIQELLGISNRDMTYTKVSHVPSLAAWHVDVPGWIDHSFESTNTWGTPGAPASELIQDSLNQRQTTKYMPDPNDPEKRVKDVEATLAAQEKQQQIKDRFASWVWEDSARALRLARLYNDKMNRIRLPNPDGSHLTFPGMATHVKGKKNFTLRPHQKNAVWRILAYGNTLLAHVVGSGKTYTMAAAGAEAKRLGLARKPLYVVPNHMLAQFRDEFKGLYPMAKLLVATKDDFAGDARREFVGRAASGDWDAIIMTHRSFESVPMSAEFQKEFIDRELDELESAIREAKAGQAHRTLVKQIEKAKERLETKLERLKADEKKDKFLSFEQMGVDMMFVDEAHYGKNLQFRTKMEGVAAPSSERAFDLFMKTQYLHRANPGRGVVFATGTPISNALAEMYTMQRYLQPEMLQERGVAQFDAWAAAFADTVTKLELAPDGSGARQKTRLAKYKNLGELAQMFRLVTDVQFAEDLNLPRPDLATGKMQVVSAPASPGLKRYVNSLVKRAKAVRDKQVDPSEDNFLRITTHGRNAAMDMRLVDASAVDDPKSKLNLAAAKIAAIHKKSTAVKGAQLVFSDLSTPGSDPSESMGGVKDWNVYEAMKGKLIALGVPAKEIRFMHEADTDEKKRKLFADVRAGRVRILIGSTEKMGAGTNVQDRLVALHHLDAPWRPSDVEQRNGRILRQGNMLFNDGKIPHVEIFAYVTEGSFDAYIWQTLERKADFIKQGLKAGPGMRTLDDDGDVEIDFATAKAIASGNPKVMEKAQVDTDVARLERLERAHVDQQFQVRKEIAALPGTIKELEQKIGGMTADIAKLVDASGDKFTVTINGVTTTKRAEAGELLRSAVQKIEQEALKDKGVEKTAIIGKFAGLQLAVAARASMITSLPDLYIALKGEDVLFRDVKSNDSGTSLLAKLEHMPGAMRSKEEDWSQQLARAKTKLAALEESGVRSFEHADKLKELRARGDALGKELEEDAKNAEIEATQGPDTNTLRDSIMGKGAEKGGPAPGSSTDLYGFADPFTAAYKMWQQANALRRARLMQTAGIRPIQGPTAPAIQRTRELAKDIRNDVYNILTPAKVSHEAAQAGRIKNARLGEKALNDVRAREALLEAHAELQKMPVAERYEFVDRYERGQPQPTPFLDSLAKTIHDVIDERTQAIKGLGKNHLRTFRKNYWGRLLLNPKSPPGQAFRETMTRRPLEGGKSFKKKRTFEYLSDALAAGYKPITDNPVDWLLLKIREMNRYIAAHEIKNELRSVGLVKFLKPSKKLPQGYAWLDDRIFTAYAPRGTQGELRIRGRYAAPIPVARIVNNYTSPGLRGNVLYDSYMFLGNTMNMIQLGFSAFHLGFVAFDATISQGALGLEQLLTKGQRLAGLRNTTISAASISSAAVTSALFGVPMPLLSPAILYQKGAKLFDAYAHGTTDLHMEKLVEAVTQAGGRVKMDDLYKSDAITKMRNALRDKRWAKTIFEVPFAAAEISMKPILEHVVPRLKLGAFMMMAERELAKLPTGASEDDIRRALQAVWTTIDDRLGQVVYDNYHWHNVTKHALMAGIRAVGWNRGSLSLTVGGAGAALGAPIRAWRIAKGGGYGGGAGGGGRGGSGSGRLGGGGGQISAGDEEAIVNHKLAYVIAMGALMAIYGGLYTYLHTGERPGTHDGKDQGVGFLLKDLYLPRTGGVNRDKSLERVSPATYIKDAIAFARHPIDTALNKVNPALQLLSQWMSNRDSFGDQVYGKHDPTIDQIVQTSKFVLNSYWPMSVRNVQEELKRGATTSEKIENFLGNAPAPRELVRTPAMNLMLDYLGAHTEGLSPEERAAANERSDLKRQLQSGEKSASEIKKLGRIGEITPRQAGNIIVSTKRDPRLLQFERLTPAQAVQVYQLGDDDEKALWERIYKVRQREVDRLEKRKLKAIPGTP